jgi:hypothetical protein
MSVKSQDLTNYYLNCTELPLYNFIKVVTTAELHWLIKEGEVDDGLLSATWNEIYTEYSDIAPSNASTLVFQITRTILHIETKIAVVQSIIERWKICYMPELIPIMHDYGFMYEFTPESMFDDVHKVLQQSQSWVVEKAVKEAELAEYVKNNQGKATTEHDYDDILSELSKFQGFQLHSRNLTVSEFVAILVRFNRQNKANGKQGSD